MGLSLEQKQAMVSEVATKLQGAQSVIVAEYRGLNVGAITQLRAKARKSGVYLRVLKNTLARSAVKGTPFEKLSEQMVGPLMYGISQDPVAGAKVLSEFAKDNESFVIKAGAMPNALMSAQGHQGARAAAQPRRAAGQAARHPAGADDEAGAHHERGAGQVRPHARRGTRCKESAAKSGT